MTYGPSSVRRMWRVHTTREHSRSTKINIKYAINISIIHINCIAYRCQLCMSKKILSLRYLWFSASEPFSLLLSLLVIIYNCPLSFVMASGSSSKEACPLFSLSHFKHRNYLLYFSFLPSSLYLLPLNLASSIINNHIHSRRISIYILLNSSYDNRYYKCSVQF